MDERSGQEHFADLRGSFPRGRVVGAVDALVVPAAAPNQGSRDLAVKEILTWQQHASVIIGKPDARSSVELWKERTMKSMQRLIADEADFVAVDVSTPFLAPALLTRRPAEAGDEVA